jgi:hypothetical protein
MTRSFKVEAKGPAGVCCRTTSHRHHRHPSPIAPRSLYCIYPELTYSFARPITPYSQYSYPYSFRGNQRSSTII